MGQDTLSRRTLLRTGAVALTGIMAGAAFAASSERDEKSAADSSGSRSRRDRGRKAPEPQPVELTQEQKDAITGLLRGLQDPDESVRMKAAQGAESVGWIAIPSLQALIIHRDANVGRAARTALEEIVQHAARPGAPVEREAANDQLIPWVLSGNSLEAQRLAVQQLQFVGTDKAVPVLERTLMAPELRDDARLSLERIPGRNATRALERSRKRVPVEYRPSIDESLRRRKEMLKAAEKEKRRG